MTKTLEEMTVKTLPEFTSFLSTINQMMFLGTLDKRAGEAIILRVLKRLTSGEKPVKTHSRTHA